MKIFAWILLVVSSLSAFSLLVIEAGEGQLIAFFYFIAVIVFCACHLKGYKG